LNPYSFWSRDLDYTRSRLPDRHGERTEGSAADLGETNIDERSKVRRPRNAQPDPQLFELPPDAQIGRTGPAVRLGSFTRREISPFR
jgi:hypothetical protein